MTTTPNLELTLLEDSQAGAHTTVNAALMLLDALLGGGIINRTTSAQPGSPSEGDAYIIAATASGSSWTGQDGKLAIYHNATWYFWSPSAGMRLWDVGAGEDIVYLSGSWVSARRPLNVMLNARIDAWTSMPSALTEFRGIASGTNAILDLTSFTTIKIGASVTSAGHSTPAKLRAQYSVNSGSSWAYFDSAGANSGPSVNIDTTGPKKSSAITMDAAARTASTWVRVVGLDGNGSVTPQFGPIFLEFS